MKVLTSASEPPKPRFIGAAPPGSAKADPSDPEFKLPLWPASCPIRDESEEYQASRQYQRDCVENQPEVPPTSEREALEIDKENQSEPPPTPKLRARELDEEVDTPQMELPLPPPAEAAAAGGDSDVPFRSTTPLRTYDTESARQLREKMPQFSANHPAGGVTMYQPVPVALNKTRGYVETFTNARIYHGLACAPLLFDESSDYFELANWWVENRMKRNS